MFVGALPYREVFSKFKTQNFRFNFVIPTNLHWELAQKICNKLKVFHDVTVLFLGRKYPTINLFFHCVSDIKIGLVSWIAIDEHSVRDMAARMVENFGKYWSSIKGVLAIGAILDPRDKMACVELYFEEIFGDMT